MYTLFKRTRLCFGSSDNFISRYCSTTPAKNHHGFWNDLTNQRNFLDRVGRDLKLNNLGDWLHITGRQIEERGGRALLNKYGHSLKQALRTIYPDYNWPSLPSKQKRETGHWNEISNQRQFFDRIAKDNKITDYDGWQSIYKEKLAKDYPGLQTILKKYYSGSLKRAIATLYPEFKISVDSATQYWANISNQRALFDRIAKELNVKTPKDWYYYKTEDVLAKGGGTVIRNYYQGSLHKTLQTLYPEFHFEIWNFKALPHNSWKDSSNLISYIDQLKHHLQIETFEDWYRVSANQVYKYGGGNLIEQNGGLFQVLRKLYPEHEWKMEKFVDNGKKTMQRWLKVAVRQMFTEEEIMEDYLHPSMVFPISKKKMQLDVFVPALKLAFEYQGQQHYQDSAYFGTYSLRKQNDEDKKAACLGYGVTLIEIPFWWDKKKMSLEATLKQHRPDLVPGEVLGRPIPLEPPTKQFRRAVERPTDEMIEISKNFMLATTWNPSIDPTGWWISEKYDGVRAYWNGNIMYSRLGKQIVPPEYFTMGLPSNVELDGELWTTRGGFQQVCNISRTDDFVKWQKVKYMIFDAPSLKIPYEDRIAYLKSLSFPEHVRVVDITKCEGVEDLTNRLHSVVASGGEGLIIRAPVSGYKKGRAHSLLRVKMYNDSEVKMIKLADSSTGLLCQQPDGQQIIIKCNGHTYANPPSSGSVITVKHAGHWDSGKLKDPVFLRERHDMEWADVLRNNFNKEIT